jgi:hypothetical protein
MSVAHEGIEIVPIPFVDREEYQRPAQPIVAEVAPEPANVLPEPDLPPGLEAQLVRLQELLAGQGERAEPPTN